MIETPVYLVWNGELLIDAPTRVVWPHVLNYPQWQHFSITARVGSRCALSVMIPRRIISWYCSTVSGTIEALACIQSVDRVGGAGVIVTLVYPKRCPEGPRGRPLPTRRPVQ